MTTPRPSRRPFRGVPLHALAAALLLALGTACSKDEPTKPTQVPENWNFSLTDLNPTSPSYGQAVSPAQHLGKPVVIFVGAPT